MGPGGPDIFTRTLQTDTADSSLSEVPEVLERPEINPFRYVELPPEDRPLLFLMTPGVIKRSIPIDRLGLRPEFQVLTQHTPAQEELLKKMNVKKLPSGIFRFSESESSVLKIMPVGFLLEGEKIAELVSYEVQKKQRGLPETTEYSPINLSFNELLQSIGQDGMNVFNAEEQEILRDLEIVLLENNGLGIIDTIRILNDGGKAHSMRVRTESHTEEILNILGLPPEQGEVVEKVLAGINKSIIENKSEIAPTSSDLWPGKFAFVSSLEEPWKITPYSDERVLSEEYQIEFIKTNLDMAIRFGERPYSTMELKAILHIAETRDITELMKRSFPEELLTQRQKILDNTVDVTKIVDYIVAHGLTTSEQIGEIFSYGRTSIYKQWPEIMAMLPEELRAQYIKRKNSNGAEFSQMRKAQTLQSELDVKKYLLDNPDLLTLSSSEIIAIVSGISSLGQDRVSSLLNSDPDLGKIYLEAEHERKVDRGIDNRFEQRKSKGVNFAGLKFDSAAEALLGFLIMNYTNNDTLIEGENFQLHGQFDFKITTKDGRHVIVEYHPESMETLKGSTNEQYYETRKKAQERYGIENTEILVFEGFGSLESTRELLKFIQSNLRMSKTVIQGVQVDTDENVRRIHSLAKNGRGPLIPKDTYVDSKGKRRYKYYEKPNAAIQHVINNPKLIKHYTPDMTLEDMIFFFRDHLAFSEEHKDTIDQIIELYPEYTPLQVGEYILADRDMHQSDKIAPLPKARTP